MISPRSSRPRSLLAVAIALSFVGIFGAPIIARATADATAVQAEYDPPLRWEAWSADDVESITTNADDQARATKGLLDGKIKSCTFFKKLEGGVITIRFKQPKNIARLAFLQGGSPNWALPRRLTIILDGDAPSLPPLRIELQNARGKIQAIPLNRVVRQLTVRVESTWREPGKTMTWGGFSGIGEADIAPAEWSLLESPLQPQQTRLRVSVTASARTQASLTAMIDNRITYDYPPLDIQAGTHDYVVDLAKLTESEPYDLPARPQHLDKLILTSTDPDTALKIETVTPLEAALPEARWDPLPPIHFPTRLVDGETWKEGHSYHTAGRFGNTPYNGLLTELVGTSWFRAYSANAGQLARRQEFDFYADGQQTDDTGRGEELWKINIRKTDADSEKINVNWTTMKVDLKIENDTLHYIYGVLAPGFLVDSPRVLNLSSRGGGNIPIRSGAPDEEEDRFQTLSSTSDSGGFPRIGPAAILTSQGLLTKPQDIRDLNEPWFVGIWGIGDDNPTFWGDKAVAVLFSSDAQDPVKWTAAGLRLPPGRWAISTAFHGLLNDNWDAALLADRARLLTRFLRTYPVDCREYYKVEDDTVRIFNEFTYERWGRPDWQAPDYAPIPPIYSWGKDSRGWPGIPGGAGVSPATIASPRGTGNSPSDIHTPFGPWRWQNGNTLAYTLPRFATPHAAFPRRPEFEDIITKVEDEVHAVMTGAPADGNAFRQYNNHPWHLAYFKRWSHGLLGGSFFGEQARGDLLDVARPLVHRMYEPSSWIPRNERFSGEPYYVRGWRDRRALPAMFGDPNSNVGQAAYSLYLYAKYSGDWALVEKLWPRVMDTLRIFEVLNDWAVPQTTSREAVKYGSIDMDTIAYAGVAAMGRMAEVLGKTGDAERIAYLQAKLAAATALRLNFARYLDPEKKFPRLYGAGFAEDGPSIETAKAGWGVGLDHIAMCLTWTGELPEMYSFLFNVLGADFMREFQADFMEKYFPDWRTMPTNTGRSAAHIAARSYLPDWAADKIKEDVNIWLKHIKKDYPPYTTAGMIGAWSGHDTGVSLINWEPARFVSSAWEQVRRLLTVELTADKPFTLEFAAPVRVAAVVLDGKPLPANALTQSPALNAANPAALHYRLQLPRGGKLLVTFHP
ncbi:hypothetical protein OpiT1DRAFT_01517 [Opitutaceae bacterium TAV1]|nr:hypothetical protein OpiT1DRAFT_01517 [Opitutaceae bacterium TAV1]